MAQAEKEKLSNILSDAFVTSCRKLSMMIKDDISVVFGSLDEFDEVRKAENTLQEVVVIKTVCAKGNLYHIIPVSCAAPLAEIMMTGAVEGGTEIGELKEKAIGEAFSQIMPDYSKAISSKLGEELTFSIESTTFCKDIKEVQKIIIETAAVVCLNYEFGIGAIAKGIFQQIMSSDIFNLISNSLPTAAADETDLNIGDGFLSVDNPSQDNGDAVMVQPVQFPAFDGQTSMQIDGNRNFDLLLDIKLKLTVELGRAELPIKKVLELTRGSIIELDKVAGEPVELYANQKLVAKGEVVVIEDNFGLRITSIVSPDDRIKNL